MEAEIISALEKADGPQSIQDLTKSIGRNRQTISRYVSALEAAGRIEIQEKLPHKFVRLVK